LQAVLSQLVGTLVRDVPPGASISIITTFEPPEPASEAGALAIQITAPGTPSPRLKDDIAAAQAYLAPFSGTVEQSLSGNAWTLSLTLGGARLAPTEQRLRTAVVVDDDVDTQEFLSAVLESQGFRVIPVSDGFDALLVIERYQPDVVLTDILMPNMNGIDLVSRIKSFRAELPVIVFSGYRDALVRNIAGLPDRILTKPMSREQVLQALSSVLTDYGPAT